MPDESMMAFLSLPGRDRAPLSSGAPLGAGILADILPGAREDDMTTSHKVRGAAMVLLLVGLAAAPARAAERRAPVFQERPAFQEKVLSAARAWFGDLLGSWGLGSHGVSSPRTADTVELKQHVDNPGQTPMDPH
jgi:hypothetical protein